MSPQESREPGAYKQMTLFLADELENKATYYGKRDAQADLLRHFPEMERTLTPDVAAHLMNKARLHLAHNGIAVQAGTKVNDWTRTLDVSADEIEASLIPGLKEIGTKSLNQTVHWAALARRDDVSRRAQIMAARFADKSREMDQVIASYLNELD